MMASDHIISVSEADFEFEVIEYSKQNPVVVDFWAEWCGPCRILGPILERLAQEAGGSFRLAKVDVDQNPNLALRYSVRTIPSVKAFKDGQLVAEFVGAQPESRIREFIKSLAPSEHDLVVEKALSLLELQEWERAEGIFRQFLQKFPDNPPALLGLARSLIAQGFLEEPAKILRNFPASKEYNVAETILPLIKALEWSKSAPSSNDDDILEAAYINALRLLQRGNYEAAMDGMLDILRQNKRYRNDEVRKALLALFEVLGSDSPITRQYRSELALILF